MKQESELTRNLTAAQDAASGSGTFNAPKTLFRIYTEHKHGPQALASFVARYFEGATLYYATGLDARTKLVTEDAIIIEVVTSAPDALQRITDLAGDLRESGQQVSVLVTKQDVRTFEITSPSINLRSQAQRHRLAGLDSLS